MRAPPNELTPPGPEPPHLPIPHSPIPTHLIQSQTCTNIVFLYVCIQLVKKGIQTPDIIINYYLNQVQMLKFTYFILITCSYPCSTKLAGSDVVIVLVEFSPLSISNFPTTTTLFIFPASLPSFHSRFSIQKLNSTCMQYFQF